MSPQSYERIPDTPRDDSRLAHDAHIDSPNTPSGLFSSRSSTTASQRRLARDGPSSPVDETLETTFDVSASDSEEDEESSGRERLIRENASMNDDNGSGLLNSESRPVVASAHSSAPRPSRPSQFSLSNDGVFANLNAKPELGEKLEEQPPSYEQAAADATPPYWETTILAPGMMSDEVFIDGLPVGSVFSFVWNMIISMAFQLVGFLLTYLLHTTHAARHGSRAGLGITLINYGFTMKGYSDRIGNDPNSGYNQPPDPNSHDFDPNSISSSGDSSSASGSDPAQAGNIASSWLAYLLMIVGWIILIKAATDFVRARRHEQLILQSPERGLNVPVVAESENPQTIV